MAGDDHEREIPITTDTRTMEQRQQDMVRNLKRKQDIATEAEASKAEQNKQKSSADRRDWVDELNHWINETHKRWNDDMRRMQEDIFTLLPVTQIDLEPLVPFNPFASYGHVPSILHRMEHQLNALHRHLNTHQPRILAFPLGSSSALMPHETRPGGVLDFLKDAYEVGEDGQLRFKVRFNVQGFGPDDIKVTTSKNCLTVTGKKATKTDTSSSTSEFSRTIYLPDSVDNAHFESRLTGDGILMLEAPVKAPDYQSLTFDSQRQLAIKPNTDKSIQLKATGVVGPQVLADGPTGKKLHVEVPVESGFDADDLLVRMDSNRVVVSGRKHVTEGSGDMECSHLKEFSRSYAVPETVDAFSIKSQLAGNTLVIEAPLLR